MSVHRVIVAGSRNYTDQIRVFEMLDELFRTEPEVEVVCGEAAGPDTLGRRWAESRERSVASFPAKWDDLEVEGASIKYTKQGKAYNARAGYVRNAQMADYAAEVEKGTLVAFWDGKSRGTKSMIDLAKRKGLDVKVFFVDANSASNDPYYDPEYERLISTLETQWIEQREYPDEQSSKSHGFSTKVREQDRSRWEEPGLLESALRAFD